MPKDTKNFAAGLAVGIANAYLKKKLYDARHEKAVEAKAAKPEAPAAESPTDPAVSGSSPAEAQAMPAAGEFSAGSDMGYEQAWANEHPLPDMPVEQFVSSQS